MLIATQRQFVAIDFNSTTMLNQAQVATWARIALEAWDTYCVQNGYANDTHVVNVIPLTVTRKSMQVIES